MSYKGSLTLTEATYQKLKNVYQAALTLKNKSPKQALIYYLRLTAKLLKRPFSLNIKNQIILRLSSMLRLYNKEQVDNQFSGMINALNYGAPPHGGIAPGIDRIVMLLANEKNIREITMFPMNQNAQDLMMSAPSDVSANQLKELNLSIVKKK